jgi:peptidoglycan hydrolase-like protein with peptidoglycan-binding domain
MTVKPLALLRAALVARRDAQAPTTPGAAARPPTPSVRQRFAVDELSRGRGAALRSPTAAAKLGQTAPASGLPVDPSTPVAALPAFAEKGPKLERGAKGPEVLLLQQTLSALGYDPGPLDGKFGQGTERAVKQYQRDQGLSADGVVGARTRSALASETLERTPGAEGPDGAAGPGEATPVTSPYGAWTDDALLAVDPKALPPAEQRAYYDEAYQRAANVYFGCVAKKPHNLSKISDADFERLSAFAGKLGLEVHRDGRVWGRERERPIFTASGGDLPPQGYDLAIDQWCLTLPGDERYESGRLPANSRYAPADGKTRCDVFVRDVIHAVLGEVIPANSANRIYEWMTGPEGEAAGWIEIDAATAQQMANEGQMVIAARHKDTETKQSGHVQVIRPQNPNRDEDPALQPPVAAQAGKTAYGYDEASKGMSRGTIKYFYHP